MTDPTTPAHQPDNLFGICHRIGEDFGFNPLWLRLGLAAGFILAPVAVICGYFAMGAVVLLSRMFAPARPRSLAQVVALPQPQSAGPVELAKAA